MKLLKFGLPLSLALVANGVQAQETVTFEGQVYPLSILTENCNNQADAQAMIACFDRLSKLIDEQSADPQAAQALDTETQEAAAQQAAAQQAAALEAAAQEAAALEAAALEAAAQEAAALQAAAQEAAAQEAAALEAERLKNLVPVPQALADLRAAAQYEDDDTGLLIAGTDCSIQVTYFGNYYHLSRRNVSTIDLFSAQFDASQLQYDQITDVPSAQIPLSKAMMVDGAMAVMRGGMALDSNQDNFEPKSARSTLGAYANDVVGQLPAREDQAFDFVLIHPERRQVSADIWTAFETFVDSCKQ